MQTVGILGAGQLGRMLALAGYPLGLRFRFFDPDPHAPAGHLAPCRTASYDDPEALTQFADAVEVITYEFENVPVTVARTLAAHCPVYPPPQALEVSQDRLTEKTFLRSLGVPTPDFVALSPSPAPASPPSIPAGGRPSHTATPPVDFSKLLPGVLKTRRMGYDGKGQQVVQTDEALTHACETLGAHPLILEAFVPFTRELSLLSVRGRNGEIRFYPLVENQHREGILRLSLAPAPDLTEALQAEAEGYARAVLEALDYVGVLAIEFFQVEGRLLANEMAPRVHNSGHWTIEGAETSQFENHLRAILGLPLGSTALVGCSAMINLIGTTPDPASILAIPGAHLHLYGKSPRPGRKLGHITLRAPDATALAEARKAIKSILADA